MYAKVQGQKINWFRDKWEDSSSKKVLRGREIFRYGIKWPGSYIQYGNWLWCPRNSIFFEIPRIFMRQTADSIIATFLDEPFYAVDSIHSFIAKENLEINLKFLLGYLNSKLANYFFRLIINEKGKVFAQIRLEHIRGLPVPILTVENQSIFRNIELMVDNILILTKAGDYLSNLAKQAKVKELENQIDQMVYELYGLTPEEIAVVEGNGGK